MREDACSICGNDNSVGVFSSGIAPVSGSMCQTCVDKQTENIGVVLFWICSYGKLSDVPDFSQTITSYLDGKYVDWNEIASHYKEHENEIIEDFQREFMDTSNTLEDDPLWPDDAILDDEE